MPERAAKVPDYAFSAKVSDKISTPQLLVLFRYENEYFPVLYDIENKTVAEPDAFEILDLLECGEDEDTAPVYAGTSATLNGEQKKREAKADFRDIGAIEAKSLSAAEAWRTIRGFPRDEITKVCGLYFVPFEQNKPRNIFGDLRIGKRARKDLLQLPTGNTQ